MNNLPDIDYLIEIGRALFEQVLRSGLLTLDQIAPEAMGPTLFWIGLSLLIIYLRFRA